MEESTRNKFIICILIGGLLLSITGFTISYIAFNYDKVFPPSNNQNPSNNQIPTPFATPLITTSHTPLFIIRHLK